MELTRILIVLDKVRHPDNLGSALRAMKNSGLFRITLSDPQTRDFERARVMATDADDLLDGMAVVDDLVTAVADATLVAGTSSRVIEGRPSVPLRTFAQIASRETASGGQVAIVFGNEQRGLSDAELDHCHITVTIPTSDAKRSINLAQSVMLVAHECFLTTQGPPRTETPADHARAGTLEALYARMETALVEAEFLNPQNPNAILSEMKRTLERARPTQREAELWLSAFKHLERVVRLTKPSPPSR